MPPLKHYQSRRAQFLAAIQNPVMLMAGGWRSRNYPDNPYVYRADSNFLFFFHEAEPGSAALFDPADKTVTLFLHDRTPEDALWHGSVPSFAEMAKKHGAQVEPLAGIAQAVRARAGDRKIESLAVADHKATATARAITGQDLDFYDAAKVGSPELIRAIGELRLVKDPAEIAEMRLTAAVTRDAHLAAMTHTRPGIYEQELAGRVNGCFDRHGCVPAYNTILSVRGEVLHNHSHDNLLKETDIVLLDAGAENRTGYCSDVTRSWPVSGRFTPEGRDIYDIVLRAEQSAIEAVKPGVRYRDLHMLASHVIAEGLVDMGILIGNPSALVESGAHGLFFPHGVGHLIGLDVHDMECFGDALAYAEGRVRSEQFGTAYLRLDLDLQPGMTFTIEPGIYFVPAILMRDEFRQKFKDQVDFAKTEQFLTMNSLRGFGGIRIEDDVLTTANGHEVLTEAIPKERVAIEALIGSAV
jgi:Xaa-Pro aminopeptidase